MTASVVDKGRTGPRPLTIALATLFAAALSALGASVGTNLVAVPNGSTAEGASAILQIVLIASAVAAVSSGVIWAVVYFAFLARHAPRPRMVGAILFTFVTSLLLAAGARFVLVSESLFTKEQSASSTLQSWADESLEENSRASAALAARIDSLGVSPALLSHVRTEEDVDQGIADLEKAMELLRSYAASQALRFQADRTRLHALRVPESYEHSARASFDSMFAGDHSRWRRKIDLELALFEKMETFLRVLKANPGGWVAQQSGVAATNADVLQQLQSAQAELQRAWADYSDLSLPDRWIAPH